MNCSRYQSIALVSCLATLLSAVAAHAETPPAVAMDPVPSQPQPGSATGQAPVAPTAAAPDQEERPPRKMIIAEQAPAPAPAEVRTDKIHDGFYVRANLGFGSQTTSLDLGAGVPNLDATAMALSMSALVGGAPAPGFIVGGTLGLDSLASTNFTGGGAEAKTGVMLTTIGPFVDGYPDPRGGFHVGGMVGPGFARLKDSIGGGSKSANGISLAAWLGYDWWVAEQWSIGGLLRFSGANTWDSSDGSDLSVDVRAVTLMVSAVYQ